MAADASATQQNANQKDRLSALPDALLLSILRRVPTFYVVRTSVLSRRWRHLWTSVTTLDFGHCDSHFRLESYKPGNTRKRKGGMYVEEENKKRKFNNFVDKVLYFHHVSVLQTFRLSCSCTEGHPVGDWVRIAVTRGMRELDLRVKLGDLVRLPSYLFASQTLVELKLNLEFSELKLPETIALVALRNMHLTAVSFVDDYLTSKFFRSCGSLTTLDLVECHYGKLHDLEIITPLLEGLLFTDDGCRSLRDCRVKISAPRLMHFTYYASLAQSYDLGWLSCLEDVDVAFLGVDRYNYPIDTHTVEEFLSQLSCTKKLKICDVCIRALSRITGSVDQASTVFCGLKSLAVDICSLDYHTVLSCILGILVVNRRCLKVLNLQFLSAYCLDSSDDSDAKRDCQKVLEVYSGQTSGVLEEVRITCDNFTGELLDLVKILLGSQSCLQRLLLVEHPYSDGWACHHSRVEALMRKVLSFPRRSHNVAVAFF